MVLCLRLICLYGRTYFKNQNNSYRKTIWPYRSI